MMTKEQAQELLVVINNWCFQHYDKRSCDKAEEYGTRIFELLPKYKKYFPSDCFYNGKVYRIAEKGYNCPKNLVACSYEKDANILINFLSLNHKKHYQSTCENGYNLYNIVNFLDSKFNISTNFIPSLLERLFDEKEIICKMNKKDFRKQQ